MGGGREKESSTLTLLHVCRQDARHSGLRPLAVMHVLWSISSPPAATSTLRPRG